MTSRNPRGTFIMVTASLLIIVIPLLLSIADRVLGDEAESSPFLAAAVDTSKGCVEETEYMRFHHMELLLKLREQAVRDGKPSEVTFDTCRDCHPNRAMFCNRCHDAASVRLDCFGCHYYPLD